jgi:hypothetical protein
MNTTCRGKVTAHDDIICPRHGVRVGRIENGELFFYCKSGHQEFTLSNYPAENNYPAEDNYPHLNVL